ncbi:MAG: hypothetical protein M3R24_01830 [Chloroflexota bacterium]|nr:hypothetical protein [Chloroflexota bacterium]
MAVRIIGMLVPGGGEVAWQYGGTDRDVKESAPTIFGPVSQNGIPVALTT